MLTVDDDFSWCQLSSTGVTSNTWVTFTDRVRACPQVLAAMAQLEAPHVSVLTKVDLLHEGIKVRTRLAGD